MVLFVFVWLFCCVENGLQGIRIDVERSQEVVEVVQERDVGSLNQNFGSKMEMLLDLCFILNVELIELIIERLDMCGRV